MRLIPAQFLLVPLALIISALLMMAAWGHRNVRESSPILNSHDAIEMWADREKQANHCLAWSVDVEIVQQDTIRTDTTKGHWFAILRCNHSAIYVRWALLMLGPWLIMNGMLLLFTSMIPPTPVKYD